LNFASLKKIGLGVWDVLNHSSIYELNGRFPSIITYFYVFAIACLPQIVYDITSDLWQSCTNIQYIAYDFWQWYFLNNISMW